MGSLLTDASKHTTAETVFVEKTQFDAVDKRPHLILSLVGIVTLALGLRVWGTSFGLPYIYHFDEHFYVNTALNLGAGVINNPPCAATGLSNISFGEYAGYYVVGRIFGEFSSPQDLEAAYRSDPTVFYLLGRLTTALLGAATVVALYALGKAAAGPTTGLWAAGFLAVSLLHVRDSHYSVPDIAMVAPGKHDKRAGWEP
jgi:hypothetical protein